MVSFVLAALLSWLVDLATLRWRSVRPTRWEKLGLAVLASKLRSLPADARVQGSLRLFMPETVLRWHRELSGSTTNGARTRGSARPVLSRWPRAWATDPSRDVLGGILHDYHCSAA